jgi:flagellar basal-body rod protein FlgG
VIKALFTSSTGMDAQQTVIDNTANNLANVNTTGFKAGQASFQDLLYVTENAPGSEVSSGLNVPTGLQVGSGVRVAGISKIFTAGALTNTGNNLNIAINGDGFLQVTLPNGDTCYTRDGNLALNAVGNVVTSNGYLISPSLTIPSDATSISIGADGTVTVQTPGSTNPTNVGQLTLARFPNEAGLSAQGNNLFLETASSGSPTTSTPGLNGAGSLQQGFLESSNVNMVNEMVNLILAQRAYEFNTRSVKAADNMLSDTSELIR